jgi:hypothetical protein
MNTSISVFGLVAAISLSSLFYVQPAQAGCKWFDKVCIALRAEARKAHEAKYLKVHKAHEGLARDRAEKAAKHDEAYAALLRRHDEAYAALLRRHAVELEKHIADGSTKE